MSEDERPETTEGREPTKRGGTSLVLAAALLFVVGPVLSIWVFNMLPRRMQEPFFAIEGRLNQAIQPMIDLYGRIPGLQKFWEWCFERLG